MNEDTPKLSAQQIWRGLRRLEAEGEALLREETLHLIREAIEMIEAEWSPRQDPWDEEEDDPPGSAPETVVSASRRHRGLQGPDGPRIFVKFGYNTGKLFSMNREGRDLAAHYIRNAFDSGGP